MARNKIGFITGVGGNPTGIGSYIKALDDAGIPAVVFANDTTTGLSDILSLNTNVQHIMLYRVVYPDNTKPPEYFSVPDYSLSPYHAAQDHWDKIEPYFPLEIKNNREKIWIQPINEVDKNRADWIGQFAYHLAALANGHGYKVAMPGWASGEPEPEHWRLPGIISYLMYCHDHPDMAAVALHEYDYGMVGHENTYPYHIGRFEELFQACDELNINRPKVLITEFGWAYGDIPPISQCMNDIDYSARLYAQYPEILGVGIWYLGPGFNNIANKVQPLIDPVKIYTINTELPGPQPPGQSNNELLNGSFEGGWYNLNGIPELQVPNDWDLWYADETVTNPYDSNPWSVFRRPETRVLPKSMLPQHEQDLFVLDGNYCIKAFKGHGSIYYSLGQWMPAGDWKLSINIYPDLIVGYNPDGSKIFADDPNSCIVWTEIDGTLKSDEFRPVPGEYNNLSFGFKIDSTSYVEVFFMQPFALANNGCFFDKWSLEKVTDTVPYVVVVNLLPQDTTKNEKAHVLNVVHDSKETILQSADDAARLVAPGKPGSKVKVWDKSRWTGGDIVQWLKDRGVAKVEELNFP